MTCPLTSIDSPDEAGLVRLTHVFENAAAELDPYPDDQLHQPFWDLGSNVLHGLSNQSIPWSVRQRLIESFEILFREFFAARCHPVLSHRSEEGSPLNIPCYMWWDLDCWVAAGVPLARNPLDTAFLASMRSILSIDHVACQESALHGLGHWRWAHGEAVEKIIDDFLRGRPALPHGLRTYARSARCGCVQ